MDGDKNGTWKKARLFQAFPFFDDQIQIERAQKKSRGKQIVGVRKRLLEYDDVMNAPKGGFSPIKEDAMP